MMNAILFAIVLGVVLLAAVIDLAAAFGWVWRRR